MKILILGGTTFLGREITNALIRRGHSVSVFTRNKNSAEGLQVADIIVGERTDSTALGRAARVANWDIVVDNLAFEGAAVTQSLNAFKSVGRYLLTSTISVYRYARPGELQPYTEDAVDHQFTPADEDLTDVHWQYARGKWDAERQLVSQSKIPWTIFRPTMVYGPRDNKFRGFWYLIRLLKNLPILVGDGGRNTFSLAYAPAVGELYAAACDSPTAANQVFNITQREMVTLSQFIEDSARALDVKLEIVSVPMTWIKDLGGPLSMKRNWLLDAGKVESHFRLPATPWESAVRESAVWFRDEYRGDKNALLATRRDEEEILARVPALQKVSP